MKDNKDTTLAKVQEAVNYAAASNGVEGVYLTLEEMKKIEKEVQAGRGDKSFLMAVLEYVQEKRNKIEHMAGEGVGHGSYRK